MMSPGQPSPRPESLAEDEVSESPSTTVGRGWVITIGVAALVVSALTIVLLPVVAALVAAWWLATDVRSTGARAPGSLGKFALLLLALVWSATAWVVVGFDAHFDCGGTLGGYGESAGARLDEACYDRRFLLVPVTVLVVFVGAFVAGSWIRRRARADGPGTDGGGRWSPGVAAAVAVGGCVLVWSSAMAVIVAL